MKTRIGMLSLVASLLAAPALAEDDPAYDRFFLMPNLSTLGAGLEGGHRANEHWQVRAGVNGFAGSFVYKRSDYDLHSRLSLLNAGITVDYFPFAGDFYLSGGARLSGDVRPVSSLGDGDGLSAKQANAMVDRLATRLAQLSGHV